MQNFSGFNNFSSTPTTNPSIPAQFSGFNQNFASIPNNFSNLNSIKLDTKLDEVETQSIPKPKLKVSLTNNERGYYSSLLSQVDPINANSVQGKEAVPFFKRSGLSVEILKKIWLIASSNNQFLERDEFYVALKLISYAQNNIEISAESIIKNIPSPLPKFAPLIEKKEEKAEKKEENSQNQPNSMNIRNTEAGNSNLGANLLNQFPEETGNMPQTQLTPPNSFQNISFPNQMQQQPNTFIQNNPNISNNNATASMMQNTSQNKAISEVEYCISLDKMHKYENCFKTIDVNHTGYISGNEAKEIFVKSGLSNQNLSNIWKLADTKKEGNLSKGEFMVALHLIMLARQGYTLPSELPKPLMDIVYEYRKPESKKTIESKTSLDLINTNDTKSDDKYKAFESIEMSPPPPQKTNVQIDNQNIINNNNKSPENYIKKRSEIDLMAPSQPQMKQKNENNYSNEMNMSLQNQAAFDQIQNEMNNEMRKMRDYHSNNIQEKVQDLNNWNFIIENYQKIMKKIQDENNFLLQESKKIEEKKANALKTIMSFQNDIDILLNKNSEIKQKIISQTHQAIEEIGVAAKNSLNQINQNSKFAYADSQNLTLMQRKQLLQEENRLTSEANAQKPQQQFPKNFDIDNFPKIEEIKTDLKNSGNIVNNEKNNYNSLNSENIAVNNQSNLITPEKSISMAQESPQKSIYDNTSIKYEESAKQNPNVYINESPPKYSNPNEFNAPSIVQNKFEPPNKNLDSDQKDFANFGFEMNQQEFNNNPTGWGDFENNFKQTNFSDINPQTQTAQNQNPGFGFGGFSEFKF